MMQHKKDNNHGFGHGKVPEVDERKPEVDGKE